MDNIRASLAKTLIPYGITGDVIGKMTEKIAGDVKEPVYGITPFDVANMKIRYEPGNDIFVYIGRRDWQFRADGSMVGAGYGLCCL